VKGGGLYGEKKAKRRRNGSIMMIVLVVNGTISNIIAFYRHKVSVKGKKMMMYIS
jgi:hypothetical protein